MDKVLNREIVVHDFRIENSKVEGCDKCLYLQLELKGSMHIVFTGSKFLMNAVEQMTKEDFPFKTVIEKNNERFEFT
jgi:hypothetical protein